MVKKTKSGLNKAYVRSLVAISMMVAWGLSVFTGFLLWVAPNGFRSGRTILVLGLTKSEWGDWHTWVSLIAIIITIIHLVVDWKGLKGSIKYLVRVNRE